MNLRFLHHVITEEIWCNACQLPLLKTFHFSSFTSCMFLKNQVAINIKDKALMLVLAIVFFISYFLLL